MKKVLTIDDSMVIQQMYKMSLTRYGCAIVTAKNGQAGLDELAKNPDVDLVLLDVNMPVMGGLEFLEHVKELRTYTHIPIVIVSTEGQEEQTKRGIELGARGYLTKPVQTRELHALIEKFFPSPTQ